MKRVFFETLSIGYIDVPDDATIEHFSDITPYILHNTGFVTTKGVITNEVKNDVSHETTNTNNTRRNARIESSN